MTRDVHKGQSTVDTPKQGSSQVADKWAEMLEQVIQIAAGQDVIFTNECP